MCIAAVGNGVSYQKNKWGCREVAPGSFRAVERDGNVVVLESNFADKDMIKECGARWRPERKRWVISIDRLPKLFLPGRGESASQSQCQGQQDQSQNCSSG